MLCERMGTYCFIGNGNTPTVLHTRFVSDLENLPKGATYLVALAEGYLR